tara:strand:- start:10118 stop:10534 length:417 start_codon:yes stop_codon:yes gene_type:complete
MIDLRIPISEQQRFTSVVMGLMQEYPEKREHFHRLLEQSKEGIDVNIKPLVWERSRQQEGYYRKWSRQFGQWCGMTEGEIHNELLCLCYGYDVVETRFGEVRRPRKRSNGTNKITYSELIDCLVRTAADMGFDVPPPK